MANRKGQGRKAKYQKSMRGFYHKHPDGKKRYSISGYVFEWVKVDNPSGISDDTPIAVLGVEEEHGGDYDWKNKHWLEFHKYIAKDMYVLLVEGGSLLAEIMTKAEVDEKYAEKIAEGDKKERRVTLINFAQFLNTEYWAWNKRELKAVEAGSTEGVLSVVVKRLNKAGVELECAYAVKHDHDEREVWDYITEDFEMQPKPDHIHGLIRVKGRGKYLSEYADIIGIAPEFLLYPEKGKNAFDNPLSYLIHIKDEDKYLYDPHDVVTLIGEDYLDVYSRKKKSWEKARAIKAKRNVREKDLDWLLDEIRAGRVKDRKQIMLSDELERIYSRHPDACNRAFQYAQEKLMIQEINAFDAHEYKMTVLFIYGMSGLGKTTICETVIKYMQKIYGWSVGKTAGKHATETWHGEQIMYMDDAESFALDATAWKHILDPYHATPIDERYQAKIECKPRVLVISSEHEPNSFFAQCSMNAGMNISQFIRRSGIAMEVMDWNLWHEYFCMIRKPIETPAYTLRTKVYEKHTVKTSEGECRAIVSQEPVIYEFPNVTYKMDTPEEWLIDNEVPVYSPWYAVETLLRAVDENQVYGISKRKNAEDIFHDSWEFTVNSLYPAGLGIGDDWPDIPPVIPLSQAEPMKKKLEEERLAEERKEHDRLLLEAMDERNKQKLDFDREINAQREKRAKSSVEYQDAMAKYEKDNAAYLDAQKRIESADNFERNGFLLTDATKREIAQLRMVKQPVCPSWKDYISLNETVEVLCGEVVDTSVTIDSFID